MAENLAAIDPFSDMCWLNPAAMHQQPLCDFSLLLHQSISPFSSSTLDPKRHITARITKRKSRATKKNQTTFITADPANFRQMVQQVTGITSSPLSHLKPERPIGRYACQLLPTTLDTSSTFLLKEHNHQQQQQQSQSVDGETAGYGASSDHHGFGIASFPTLESWKVM